MIHRISIVSLIMAFVFLSVVIVFGFGCTRVTFHETRLDGTEIKGAYTYWLQDKGRKVRYDPATAAFSIETTNSSDPAVEAFKAGLAAGVAGAVVP